jgi:hypothetical protein
MAYFRPAPDGGTSPLLVADRELRRLRPLDPALAVLREESAARLADLRRTADDLAEVITVRPTDHKENELRVQVLYSMYIYIYICIAYNGEYTLGY